jgi:hypothetical protein
VSIAVPPLLAMSQAGLDEMYRHNPAGAIPDGACQGAAIVFPGTPLAPIAARIIRAFFWQGKTFDAERGELRNSITAFRLPAIKARVYEGPSRLDGKEGIILDYSRTSLLARWIRDEIREVSPGVYLGLAYLFRFRMISFALVVPSLPPTRSSP